MSIFRLPDLGEGLREAEIVAWHVAVGDHVVAGQPLVSVETDKAVVEVPSPQSGHIAKLHGAAGEHIETGAPLVAFTEGETADTGTVVGDISPQTPAVAPAPAGAGSAPADAGAAPADAGQLKATPAVRALAHRLGVDIAAVTPTGAQGQVTRANVELAAAGSGEGAVEKLSGPRRAMARNMARSHVEVVPATVTEDADIDHFDADADVTVALVQAMAAGAAASPALNAWFDGTDLSRRLNDRVDIGIAMDTPDGLFVPVLRDAGNASAAELRHALEKLKTDVVSRRLKPADLHGQTITLSNFGLLGGRYAGLVVVPPQVAILGAGRIVPRVVVRDGAPAIRRLLPLSLTFDHRAVTGGEAARFLTAVIAALESAESAQF